MLDEGKKLHATGWYGERVICSPAWAHPENIYYLTSLHNVGNKPHSYLDSDQICKNYDHFLLSKCLHFNIWNSACKSKYTRPYVDLMLHTFCIIFHWFHLFCSFSIRFCFYSLLLTLFWHSSIFLNKVKCIAYQIYHWIKI